MIKKRDNKTPTPSDTRGNRLFNPQGSGSHTPGAAVGTPPQQASAPPPAGNAATPTIGATMTIKGDLVGKEDVLVRGRLEGSVILKDNDIVIEESGEVEGSIIAKHVLIKGQVNGDIQGLDKVTIFATGRVQRTITAPRVVLEDGGRFKGMIDMPLDEQDADGAAGKSQELNPPAPKRLETAKAATGS